MGLFRPKEEQDINNQVQVPFSQEPVESQVSYREVPVHFLNFSFQDGIPVLIAIYEDNGKACKFTYEFDEDNDTDDISDMVEFTDSGHARLVIKSEGVDEVYEKIIIPRNIMFEE